MAAFARVRTVAAVAGIAAAAIAIGVGRPVSAQSDLDAFMREVMERRDDNWRKLQQYVLDEQEAIDLRGPSNAALWGERREYAWYIRDGFFVRSPVRVNGVTIGEADRHKYEDDYLRRVKARDRRAQQGGAPSSDAPVGAPPGDVDALIRQTREPQFISSAYFLRFHFDEGRYALVGRETVNGRELLRVEYYPATLFTEQDRRGRGRGRQRRDDDEQLLGLMDKASRVTLWIDQPSRQIVTYKFENVTLNFIPANMLARVTSVGATMTMGEPFPGVWLPRSLDVSFTITFAIGDVAAHYTLDYTNYRQADAKARIVPPDAR
jgi:hypothetical protein